MEVAAINFTSNISDIFHSHGVEYLIKDRNNCLLKINEKSFWFPTPLKIR